jgi:phospholipase/carboxylesterase
MSANRNQTWIELPPISATAPARLMIVLHPNGSSPELIAPAALAWQLKFPGATVAIMSGFVVSAIDANRRDWFEAAAQPQPNCAATITDAALRLSWNICGLQNSLGLSSEQTLIVGFSHGATLAIELVRKYPDVASIVIGYATRLAQPMRDEDRCGAVVHLIHGEFDSIVPLVYSQRAYRNLRAIGTQVTLDIVDGSSHEIDQELINLGTARAMQTVFRDRGL